MTKFVPLLALLALAACKTTGQFDESGGVYARRSPCPAVAVPAQTGDITVFNPPTSRDARAIDVTAVITDIRSTCTPGDTQVAAAATFQVLARRTDVTGPRDVVLPYFVTIVQGGDTVVAKRIAQVALHFDAGQARASAQGGGGSSINLSAASLPPEIVARLTKKRNAKDADASVDPMAAPDVRAAVARATFEMLVGFQLTPDQLRYNATR